MATTKPTVRKPATKAVEPAASDDSPMQRFHPNSRANRIAALGVGESVSEAKRLDIDTTGKAEMDEVQDNLKSTLSAAASRASERSGYTFVTEIGQILTRSGGMLVVAVVTRTA